MRNRLLFCMLFAAAVVLLAAVVVGAFGWPDRDRDAIGYNVLAEKMYEGTVASKGHIIEGLMYFPLRMADAMVEVQIGPKEFVERSNFKLKTGDMVTVVGMPVVMNAREVVLAREVSSMNGVLVVRNHFGLPLWETGRPIQMDPERGMRLSEICAITNPERTDP
jgi:hypothetical protein